MPKDTHPLQKKAVVLVFVAEAKDVKIHV